MTWVLHTKYIKLSRHKFLCRYNAGLQDIILCCDIKIVCCNIIVEHLSYNFVATKKIYVATFNNFLFITVCRDNKTLCHDINFRTIGLFNVAKWELFVATN